MTQRSSIDRDEFEGWLQAQPSQHIFWTPGSRDGWCPIARFMQEKKDDPDIRVSTTCISKYGFFYLDLPDWARVFVHRFDHSTIDKPATATAALAVEVLKTCERVT